MSQAQQFDPAAFSRLVLGGKPFSPRWLAQMGLILAGSLIMAAGYVYFIVPYKIVPGGVYGIGIVLHYMFGVPTGLSGLVLNIPLLWIGVRVLGARFGFKTVLGLVLTSAFIDLLTAWWGNRPLVDEALLSAVFGGVLIGLGLGLIFRARATSGGTDIVAQVVHKLTRLNVGQVLIMADSLIVGVGILAFHDIKIALYAFVTIYVTGRVVDSILMGLDFRKVVFIISERHAEIRGAILRDVERGGTYLAGRGMYSGREKQVIFVAVGRRDLLVLEDQVRAIDPAAFITVLDAYEVLGEGFKPLAES